MAEKLNVDQKIIIIKIKSVEKVINAKESI